MRGFDSLACLSARRSDHEVCAGQTSAECIRAVHVLKFTRGQNTRFPGDMD